MRLSLCVLTVTSKLISTSESGRTSESFLILQNTVKSYTVTLLAGKVAGSNVHLPTRMSIKLGNLGSVSAERGDFVPTTIYPSSLSRSS